MKKTYAVVAAVALILSLIPIVALLFLDMARRSQPSLVDQVKSKYVTDIHSHYIKLSNREYLVVEPLSWVEHTWATLDGYGSFIYTFPVSLHGSELIIKSMIGDIYVFGDSICETLREKNQLFLNSRPYKLLLRDDCYWLKKLAFDTSKSWYATLALIGHFKNRYLAETRLPKNYWVWFIAHRRSDGLYVKFYNALDYAGRKEIMEDIRRIINESDILFVKPIDYPLSDWVERGIELEEKGIPFLIIYADALEVDVKELGRYGAELVAKTRYEITFEVDWRLAHLLGVVDTYSANGFLFRKGVLEIAYDSWTNCEWYEKYGIKCEGWFNPINIQP